MLSVHRIEYSFAPGENNSHAFQVNEKAREKGERRQKRYMRLTLGAWSERTRSRTIRSAHSIVWDGLHLSVLTTVEAVRCGGELLVEMIDTASVDVIVLSARVQISSLLGMENLIRLC